MRFGVLGPLAVWDDDGMPVTVPELKVRALLADLLAHEQRPVSADRLIHDLWGDAPPGRPPGALQAKVSQLRRILGRHRVERQPPGYRLRLDPTTDEVDADRFHALVAQARPVRDQHVRAALLTEALDLWRGPAYADFADEEFVRGTARRLAEQRLSVLEEQAEARLETDDRALLAGELSELVARHPLRERLRALQIRALYLTGRQSEALDAYETLRSHLAEHLGVDPSPALSALHRAVLRQDPALEHPLTDTASGAATTAPTRGRDSRAPGTAATRPTIPMTPAPPTTPTTTPKAPHPDTAPQVTLTAYATPFAANPFSDTPPIRTPHSNLPTALTPLIGRAEALTRLTRLLTTARLVTLTGPGGVGKTRLAGAAAGTVRADDLPDGVWLAEFSGVRDATTDDLAQIVAAALGVRDDSPSALPGAGAGAHAPSPAHRLAAVVRDRRTLLVLDNCEHVVDATAALTELLLRTAPGLRVLVTSQEPLRLAGEAVFLVEPLATDDAVRLFTARAAASAPGFPSDPDAVDPAARAAVAEICRRLDGIPLALELAATRVRTLGVSELAARRGERFRVLTVGQRGAPP
ncbi:BTAD domain-containing putative transcriptional regulator, partial [Streptomyces sp. NPDC059477]|uniref:AfsR/SARP family transcriptional regulator n=1 Tax=Streptomyces sp. NPDC059477 TaxID=3346847 RepID=UPI00368D53B4